MLVQIRASTEASASKRRTSSPATPRPLGSVGDTKHQAASELAIVLKIIDNYGRALRFGHAHIFQSLPRLLTLWFETAEASAAASTKVGSATTSTVAKTLSKQMAALAQDLPAYQWLTALPQLISRISHNSGSVHKVLDRVLVKILKQFPAQSLWALVGASETVNPRRKERIRNVLERGKNSSSRLKTQVRHAVCHAVNDMMNNRGVVAPLPLGVCDVFCATASGPNVAGSGADFERHCERNCRRVEQKAIQCSTVG